MTSYTLDLNTGLTQVLSDGKNSYLYGRGRIDEFNCDEEQWLYLTPQSCTIDF